jgi:hypothetical protein
MLMLGCISQLESTFWLHRLTIWKGATLGWTGQIESTFCLHRLTLWEHIWSTAPSEAGCKRTIFIDTQQGSEGIQQQQFCVKQHNYLPDLTVLMHNPVQKAIPVDF